jgi:aldehyde dehydrogenase (NAD+)
MVNISNLLSDLDLKKVNGGTSSGSIWLKSKGDNRTIYSPVDGNSIADVIETDDVSYKSIIKNAEESFVHWRKVPAPQRGEIVRQIGNELRKKKNSLGQLVSYEMGKSLQEGLGEVQEMIDICDFSVGLSRQLYGLTMHSERPGHRMYEQWHPLGIVGIISSFNFPVAVWSWNAMIALVCGNVCLWKPSKKTPISAIATQKIISNVFEKNNVDEGICSLVIDCSERKIGTEMLNDKRISLISATGSTAMGKYVAKIVGDRLGKTLLELGGNNAIIVSNKADLNIALRAAVFGAVGTAGQRCTSTRRLIVHKDIFEEFKNKLVNAYGQIKIGNPLDKENHMGPLIDRGAVKMYLDAIEKINKEGGEEVVVGGELSGNQYQSGCYVKPAIYEVKNEFSIVQDETFAPILYLIKYSNLDEAIKIQNDVPQGLSSSIMTKDLSESEQFLSAQGSDCGIANVNIGTSGAEIGGAFGGEKETGGGRESGSDSWKAYMRRQTNTINYSDDLPLAQGIKFDF